VYQHRTSATLQCPPAVADYRTQTEYRLFVQPAETKRSIKFFERRSTVDHVALAQHHVEASIEPGDDQRRRAGRRTPFDSQASKPVSV
jgi:hypothetical protein